MDRHRYRMGGKSIREFKWVYVVGMVVVTAGVMGFGAIGTVVFSFDHRRALTMLLMIPIMSVIYYLAMKPVVRMIDSRINRLIFAMDEVANGNLEHQIDMENGGEFTKAYGQFNAMVLELKKTKQEMQDFTNEFAHEFKTPITAISGFSEHLLSTGEGLETPERMEQLKMISEESERLLKLSMNTLLLSKVDAMQVVENKEEYDLAEQLRRCVILMFKELEKKDLELEMDEDLTLPFYGNAELLQHVWINLLSNAVKFTPAGGLIRIEGEKSGDRITVSISDNGVGMDEKTLGRIFEKYYQNDSCSIAGGSGIGLSIVKRIVTLSGGEIRAESRPGEGASFIVTFDQRNEVRRDHGKSAADRG